MYIFSTKQVVHMWQRVPGSPSRRKSVSRASLQPKGWVRGSVFDAYMFLLQGGAPCREALAYSRNMEALNTSTRTQPWGCREARDTEFRRLGLPRSRCHKCTTYLGTWSRRCTWGNGRTSTAASPNGRTSRGSRLQARPARAL
jgi:hypothetical protein